jgi:hypothetical protein
MGGPRPGCPGREERDRGIVVDRFGVHGAQDAQVARDFRGVGEQGAELDPCFRLAREVDEGARKRQNGLISAHSGQALPGAHAVGQGLAVQLAQARLGIERLELRRAAGLKQVDHALGARGEMRRTIVTGAQQVRERERAEAEAGAAQE